MGVSLHRTLSKESRAILEQMPAKSIPLITWGKSIITGAANFSISIKHLCHFPASTALLNGPTKSCRMKKVVEGSHLPAGRQRGLQEQSSPSPPRSHWRSLWERVHIRNAAWKVERGRGQARTAHWDTVDEWETKHQLYMFSRWTKEWRSFMKSRKSRVRSFLWRSIRMIISLNTCFCNWLWQQWRKLTLERDSWEADVRHFLFLNVFISQPANQPGLQTAAVADESSCLLREIWLGCLDNIM